jgi:hypothetical protein
MDEFTDLLLKAGFQGEIDSKLAVLDSYSHDASMFELRPKLVVKPKDAKDVEILVKLVNSQKQKDP